MSTIDKLKELNAARAKVASLEQAIAAELNTELAALPAQYGFESVVDFVAAVAAAGKPSSQKTGKSKVVAKPEASAKGKRRKKRAVITDATREEVKQLVAAGKTGSEIAKVVGISLPSVQNIKKALGLVGKPGKAKAAPASKSKVAVKAVPAAKRKAPAKKKRRTRAIATAATKAEVKKEN